MKERYELQVFEEGGWATSWTGEYTGWMEDRVAGGDREEGLKYRCFDTVTSRVVSEWDPEAKTWTEVSGEITVRQTLEDEVTGTSLGVEVECKPGGITLKADDHGDSCTVPGDGEVVFIEFRDGQLWVRVWADVNQEDPISISLEGARESNRRDG